MTTPQLLKVLLRTTGVLRCRHPKAYDAVGYRFCDDCLGLWRLR